MTKIQYEDVERLFEVFGSEISEYIKPSKTNQKKGLKGLIGIFDYLRIRKPWMIACGISGALVAIGFLSFFILLQTSEMTPWLVYASFIPIIAWIPFRYKAEGKWSHYFLISLLFYIFSIICVHDWFNKMLDVINVSNVLISNILSLGFFLFFLYQVCDCFRLFNQADLIMKMHGARFEEEEKYTFKVSSSVNLAKGEGDHKNGFDEYYEYTLLFSELCNFCQNNFIGQAGMNKINEYGSKTLDELNQIKHEMEGQKEQLIISQINTQMDKINEYGSKTLDELNQIKDKMKEGQKNNQ